VGDRRRGAAKTGDPADRWFAVAHGVGSYRVMGCGRAWDALLQGCRDLL